MKNCNEAEVNRLLTLVSEQRCKQALRYKHLFGRYCCLRSWEMLKELLDESMSGLMDEWQYSEYGKPFFNSSSIHSFVPYFSISHCKKGIAVALSDKPIGIDIEGFRFVDEEMIRRTMNADEQQHIHSIRDFTRFWTQKEAVLKAIGTGIESFEQLQQTLLKYKNVEIETIENENYIVSIAYE